MLFLYNLAVQFAGFLLKTISHFSPKMKFFIDGRKDVFQILEQNIKSTDATIWFHAASLGEYEQGLPVIEAIKKQFPTHKIVLTFFSPSGFEVRKNNTIADVTVYLPLDTKKNAQEFLKFVHPELVFFIKYEYWLNYLAELKNQNIKTYLISGILRDDQLFFKWYGGFYRKALETFTYFFVQNENSKKLLQQLGKNNVSVSGDTRFDRVVNILEKDNTLDFVSQFKNNELLVVVGSSWPKDEKLLVDFINSNPINLKFIIAPHNIKEEQIKELQKSISKKTILFSEKIGYKLEDIIFKNELYTFDNIELENIIKTCDDLIENLIIFGHNSAITDFVNKTGDIFIENVPTSGLVKIEFDVNSWKQITNGKIKKAIFPKDLR